MSDVLAEIVARKRQEIVARKAGFSPWEMARVTEDLPPTRGFQSALQTKIASGQLAVIAEIKRASPSGGLIRPDFDPSTIARQYEVAGAACLSVLTDEPYFQGTPEHLREARAASNLPILRKDFMVDPYQIDEARLWGADCILLILATLDDGLAGELSDYAYNKGLDVLVEVHDQEEMNRAIALGAQLIGINNRNLKTLKTSLETTAELAPLAPKDRHLVCESGLKTPADLQKMASIGVRSFLIGESLLREPDPGAALSHLLAE